MRCRRAFAATGDWRAYWLFADVNAQAWRMSVKPPPVRWLDFRAGRGRQQFADRLHKQGHFVRHLTGIAVQ
jgi:hypothetical protein